MEGGGEGGFWDFDEKSGVVYWGLFHVEQWILAGFSRSAGGWRWVCAESCVFVMVIFEQDVESCLDNVECFRRVPAG